MASELAQKECIPCKGGVSPLQGEDIDVLHTQLLGDWQVVDDHHLEKTFSFKDFRQALDFTIRVGELAEDQWHQPNIRLTWGKVKLSI